MELVRMWDTDEHFKTRLATNDPDLAEALRNRKDGNSRDIEKIVGERLKEQFERKRKE
jgi:DNA damage-inducible protein 1